MAWEAENTTLHSINSGHLCCLCQAPLSAPPQRGFRYCTGCVPTPADTPHRVHVAIDHHNEGWGLSFSSAGPPPFTYWMVGVSDDQLARMVQRLRMSPYERAMYPEAMRAWGRYAFHAHLSATELRNLYRAWQHDPRNGYEKRKARNRKTDIRSEVGGAVRSNPPR